MKFYNRRSQEEGRFQDFIFCSDDRDADIVESHGQIVKKHNVSNIIKAEKLGFANLSELQTVKDLAIDIELEFDIEEKQAINIACDLIDESKPAFQFFFNLLQDSEKAQHKKCDVQIAIAKVAIDELGYDAVSVLDKHGINLVIKI
jgi:hypothetical protein